MLYPDLSACSETCDDAVVCEHLRAASSVILSNLVLLQVLPAPPSKGEQPERERPCPAAKAGTVLLWFVSSICSPAAWQLTIAAATTAAKAIAVDPAARVQGVVAGMWSL